MNQEKVKTQQSQAQIGGKGTVRRKKKVVRKTAGGEERKLEAAMKKLGVNAIPGIDEANMIKEDGTVIHFENPKVQANLVGNTFAIMGQSGTKELATMLPGILNQLGPESLITLKNLAAGLPANFRSAVGNEVDQCPTVLEEDNEEDVPELVGNFDDPSKKETVITQ